MPYGRNSYSGCGSSSRFGRSANRYEISTEQRQSSSERRQTEQGGLEMLQGLEIDPKVLEHENPNNCTDLAPGLSLDQYRLNVDNCPNLVKIKRPCDKVKYLQEIAVQHLQPPPLPRSGDIIIQEEPTRQVAPAPPLVIREHGARAATPPPMIIREAPPPQPHPLPGKVICIPGKIIPPPARKVIVEKCAPEPEKPQDILIERWLPYGPQTQRVIYKPAEKPCIIPDPKNVVIEWQDPDVEIHKEFKDLGVRDEDPCEYTCKHGASLVRTEQLPEVAIKYSSQACAHIQAEANPPEDLILEGDIEALKLIDLEQHGLSYLKNKVGINCGSSGSSFDHSVSTTQTTFIPHTQRQISYSSSTSTSFGYKSKRY